MAYELHCFPSTDATFVSEVHRACEDTVRAEREDHDNAPERLAAVLRQTYPLVVVVRANAMATLGDRRVLYVYRDGSAGSSGQPRPG